MIVVDTNVLSEPFRPQPEPRVIAWLRAHADDICMTSVSVHELRFGVARLPEGQRRAALATGVERLVRAAGQQVLPYDHEAARVHALLRAEQEAAGRTVPVEDGMIAAIALVHRCAVATRNVRDFADLGLEVIDPWTWDGPAA
jgi:toxin FitB